MVTSEFLQHSQLSHYGSFDIQALWETEGQSNSVQAGPSRGLGHWERGPFHTRQISFPPSLGTVKDTHQGTSLCPTACLATTTPPSKIFSVYVYVYNRPLWLTLHFFLVLPRPLRSASPLTCILRGTLSTYLPTTEIQNHKGITGVNASITDPADSPSDVLTENRRAPSDKNREIWFVHPSSRGLSGRLPECKWNSRVL